MNDHLVCPISLSAGRRQKYTGKAGGWCTWDVGAGDWIDVDEIPAYGHIWAMNQKIIHVVIYIYMYVM